MVHSDECPVCDDAGDAKCTVYIGTSDEIFNGRGIKELDVGEGENFRKEGGSEECLFTIRLRQFRAEVKTYCMLHNHKVSFVLEWHTKISQESISGLAHDHGAEQLATEPSSASWRDGSFNDGNLEVRTSLAEHISSAETARPSANNDNIGLSVRVEVIEVTACHSTADLGLANGSKLEALVPFLGQFFKGLRLCAIDWEGLRIEAGFQWNAVDSSGLFEDCSGWSHFD